MPAPAPKHSIQPLIDIDKLLDSMAMSQVTGIRIDQVVQAAALNIAKTQRSPEFIAALVTHQDELWQQLLKDCSWRCWSRREGCGFAIYEPHAELGVTRVYQWTPARGQRAYLYEPHPASAEWKTFGSEDDLVDVLKGSGRPQIYEAWLKHRQTILAMPTQLAEARLSNTTVEQAVIFSRGDGCVFCGETAGFYAGTTSGDGRHFIQLPVCKTHDEHAKASPTVLSLVAELLHAQIDLPELQRLDRIPDDAIFSIVNFLAVQMKVTASTPEKRGNGWHASLARPSGWTWKLRLRSLSDYAYVLLDPKGKERHKIDSAAHHPELPFGPAHQHARPNSKKDVVSPSATYGVPLFDFVLLNAVTQRHEAGQ